MTYRIRFHLCCLWLSLAFAAPTAHAQDGITVYRCTDAKGHLTLQDAPCAKGETQQKRSMVQPQDPPTKPLQPLTRAPRDVSTRESVQPPTIIIARAPQPLYECVRPDGSVYSSDSSEGNPRYVSVYDLADDGLLPRRYGRGERRQDARAGGFTPADPPLVGIPYSPNDGTGIMPVSPPLVGIAQGPQHRPLPPTPRRLPGYPVYGYGPATTLVRDECHPLPPAEVCARLRDDREDIRQRFFNAQQLERERLDRQERVVDARLSADCGAY